MSIDHYRNVSFSAYIEYFFLDCTGKFAENVLRIFPRFMLMFSPHVVFALEAFCTSLCGGEKCTFLVHKVIRNRSIWGPCHFLVFITKHLVKFVLSICLETWKNLYGRNLEKWRFCIEMRRIFEEKWKTIWKNAEFDWKSERIYMAKIWKSEECVWKRERFIKKSEEFLWKNDEFVWTSERIYLYGPTVF